MTEQYAQNEINLSALPASFTSSASVTSGTASSDSQLVLVDTSSTTAFTLTLPTALSAAGQSITIVAVTGAAAAVTIAVAAGDSFGGPAITANPIATNGGNVTLTSDGGTTWYNVSDNT